MLIDFSRRIQKLSAEQIADAVAKAISELTDRKYEANIRAMDFEPDNGAGLSDEVDIHIRLFTKEPTDEQIQAEIRRATEVSP